MPGEIRTQGKEAYGTYSYPQEAVAQVIDQP